MDPSLNILHRCQNCWAPVGGVSAEVLTLTPGPPLLGTIPGPCRLLPEVGTVAYNTSRDTRGKLIINAHISSLKKHC